MAKKEEENLKSILELKKDINKLTDEYNQLAKKSIALTEEEKSRLQEIDKERKKVAKELRDANKTRLENLANEERALSSLSDLYSGLTRKEQQRIIAQTDREGLSAAEEKSLNNMASLTRDLAQLNRDDFAQRNSILDQLAQEEENLRSLGAENQDLLQNLAEQKKIALNLSNLSKDQKEQIEGQLAAYKGMKNLVGGILNTFATLTSGPAGFFGTLFIAAGKAADKIGQVNKELGTTFSLTNSAANRAGLLSFVFDDAVSNTRALSRELGGLDKASGELQVNMSLVARSFGISGDEAAVLVGQFSRLQGGSTDTAMNMLATTRALAEANDVAPGDVLQEMAGSTEAFALYARDGGTNLAMAGVQAKKLGVELNTLTGITDSLLDFETSITKELELGAMLGKNINLNRARALAYEGQIGGAVQETLTQLGGIDAFNKMDYYAKQETAKLLGVSVAQLQKMAAYQEQGKDLSKVTAENFDQMDAATQSFLNVGLGNALQAMGGMIMAGGQAILQWKTLNALQASSNVKLQTSQGIQQVMAKNGQMYNVNSPQGRMILSKGGTQSVQQGLAQRGMTGAQPAMGGQQSVAGKANRVGGGINMKSVLQGAAAMLILAGALFVFAKAAQEFGEVPSWPDVFIGIGAMATLGVVAAVLGAGPIAAAASTGALVILGLASAFAIFGAGAMLFAGAVSIISNSLQPMADGLTSLIGLVPGIFGLAAALAVLGGGLAILGALGSVALPVLGTLALFGGVAMLFAGALNLISSSFQPMSNGLTSLVGLVPSIFALAGALTVLGGSLAILGVLGSLAIPVLGMFTLFSAGAMMFASALNLISNSLQPMSVGLSSLIGLTTGILGLAGAFAVLGGGLAILGTLGSIGLPILATLALFGGLAIMLVNSLQPLSEGITSLVGLTSDIFTLAGALVTLGGSLLLFGVLGSVALPVIAAFTLFSGAAIMLANSLEPMSDGLSSLIGLTTGIFGLAGALSVLGASFGILGTLGLLAVPIVGMFSVGAMMIASAIEVITNSLQPLAEGLSSLIGLTSGIFGLAGALTTLGGGLAVLGTAGSLALPVLAALGGLGLVAGMIGIGGGGESENETTQVGLSDYQDKMLVKMEELIGAVKQYKDVYMDGEKVTARVSTIQDRTIRNDFAIGAVTG